MVHKEEDTLICFYVFITLHSARRSLCMSLWKVPHSNRKTNELKKKRRKSFHKVMKLRQATRWQRTRRRFITTLLTVVIVVDDKTQRNYGCAVVTAPQRLLQMPLMNEQLCSALGARRSAVNLLVFVCVFGEKLRFSRVRRLEISTTCRVSFTSPSLRQLFERIMERAVCSCENGKLCLPKELALLAGIYVNESFRFRWVKNKSYENSDLWKIIYVCMYVCM